MSCKIVQDYVITPFKLGQGCFGTVYRGYMKENKNELLAVKTIPLKNIKNEQAIRREIQILLKLKSPNIVKFYRPAKTANHLYLFLEYCQEDLKTYVKRKGGKLSEAEVQTILIQICKGFQTVYQNRIIHRDVKPANFLIHNGVVKISDFGFARAVEDLSEPLVLTFLGSPLYMSPQILAKERFSSKCDIWSLGVTIYEILYGQTPFSAKNPKELLEKIRNEPLTFPENIHRSPQVIQLLRRMLTVNEQDRISWIQLFEHSYVQPVKEEVEEEEKSQNSLLLSFTSNNAHLARHKVVAKTTYSAAMSHTEIVPQQKLDPKSHPDFAAQLKEQKEQIEQYVKVQQIDELMRYKRNVSVFLNVQCNTFFSEAEQLLSEQCFHIGLYLLLRQQIRIHNQLKSELQEQQPIVRLGGTPSIKMLPQVWQCYRKSPCYARIVKIVDCDLKHLENYFKEVSTRVEAGLKTAKKKNEKLVDCFCAYRDQADQQHSEPYSAVIKVVIEELLKHEKKLLDRRLISKLRITMEPFRYLHPKMDFGLFYEEEEKEIELIRKKFPQIE